MEQRTVAGVDWAGGTWLAIVFDGGSYSDCVVERDFREFFEAYRPLDDVFIDVPIGLPEDGETVVEREKVDSLARSITGRPSSVFPVPSRTVATDVYKHDVRYDEAARRNEADIGKGLSSQSYHITDGIGEIDSVLRGDEQLKHVILESHPEVCFRGLLGRELHHSKKTAAGVGERLEALGELVDEPGALLRTVTDDLASTPGADGVEIDDVLDALALGIAAHETAGDPRTIPKDPETDRAGLPMQMVYWARDPIHEELES
jgi:predicted RNase H-like nuclease